MEGGRKERCQETTAGQALQGRDSYRNWRGEAHTASEGRKERKEFRQQSFSGLQTQDSAREFLPSNSEVSREEGVSGSRDKASKDFNQVFINSDNNKDDRKNTFRIVYTNARSIIGKIDLLRTYVCYLQPQLVCICEVSTHSGISDTFLAIDGYSLVIRADGSDTKDGGCRGLLVYAREGVLAGRLESELIDEMVECEGVTIPWGKGRDVLTVVLAYRAPGSVADNSYTDRFCELLGSLKSPAVIVGDLNYPGLDWERMYADSTSEGKVMESVQNHFWTQHVDFPTHRNPSTGIAKTTLDICLSTSPELVLGVTSEGEFSDHVIFSVDMIAPDTKDKTKEFVPDWSKADLDQIATNLSLLDWDSELKEMSGTQARSLLKEKIVSETHKCVPKKLRRVSNRPLWMTRNVLRLIRKKRRVWRWYSSSEYSRKDFQEYEAYKKVQAEVRKAVKNAKKNFERKLAKDARKNNSKPFYTYMKKTTSNKVGIGPLKDSSGNMTSYDEKMAELLNSFFCSVFTREDVSNLPEAEQLFEGDEPLVTSDFTEEKVRVKLLKLKQNSAPGPDRLWPRVLHKHVLCHFSSTLYNLHEVPWRGDSSS